MNGISSAKKIEFCESRGLRRGGGGVGEELIEAIE